MNDMNGAIGGDPSSVSGHYPELGRFEGLTAAIRATAAEHGISLGDEPRPTVVDWTPQVAAFESPGRRMKVNVLLEERGFVIWLGSGRGLLSSASGTTADIVETARVIAAWKKGATLKELSDSFPFMTYSRLSQGYEDGNPEAVMWHLLLENQEFTQYRDLLAALHAEPRLAEMFPFFSMWTLRLARDAYREQAGELLIQQQADGSYLLWSSKAEEDKREFRRLDDLVAAAVALRTVL
ncbi:DUF6193 family natural product biosynthesis protein [Kitasatospora sp. NPDC086801]|uniref:DUF6193 family natural product biosynthesis protein n=1 Tax=Kitasatospora sp. NPDC086801 TaxID=3364066 RepID=UPI003823389D